MDQLEFSPRESEVIKAILNGFTDSATIAGQVKPTGRGKGVVSEQAVRHLVSRILTKTGCRDKLQLALWAVRNGFPVTWTGPQATVPQGWEQDGLFGEAC